MVVIGVACKNRHVAGSVIMHMLSTAAGLEMLDN